MINVREIYVIYTGRKIEREGKRLHDDSLHLNV